MKTNKLIPNILGKNNEYMKKYPILGEGGFSFVYDLFDYDNLVLKHSYNPMDGFRYLADLSISKRKKIGLRPIEERKVCGDDVYYLMPKLMKIDFNNKELEYIQAINEIGEAKDILLFDDFVSDRVEFIKSKIQAILFLLKEEVYELDISSDNIMQDKYGNIYLTDPVAEML